MYIFDSNIIYAAIDEYAYLRDMIRKENPTVSEISKLEVLGYHKLQPSEYRDFEAIFNQFELIPISSSIIEQAVNLRRAKSMSVGDAIIASTALQHGLKLVTRNTKDFSHITDLQLINPIET